MTSDLNQLRNQLRSKKKAAATFTLPCNGIDAYFTVSPLTPSSQWLPFRGFNWVGSRWKRHFEKGTTVESSRNSPLTVVVVVIVKLLIYWPSKWNNKWRVATSGHDVPQPLHLLAYDPKAASTLPRWSHCILIWENRI